MAPFSFSLINVTRENMNETLQVVQSIRTSALGRMLPNLPCQLCDLLPVAVTTSSIEKIEIVPSFVWLSLLNLSSAALTWRLKEDTDAQHGPMKTRIRLFARQCSLCQWSIGWVESSILINFTKARARTPPLVVSANHGGIDYVYSWLRQY